MRANRICLLVVAALAGACSERTASAIGQSAAKGEAMAENERGRIGQLPYAHGRTFASLDEYLEHLQRRAGPIGQPWYREVRPGVYELVTTTTPRREPQTFTREQLMREFGFERPHLAVPAPNPHAGEDGMLGREEIDVIVPAMERLREEGVEVSGPYAPDIMFHEQRRCRYDAALCMYHDQGLIPLKTLHFDEGINVTLGLPIVRTSPDHGTAFDIAGQNRADPGAMIAAIRTAGECARRLAAAA